MKCHTEKQNDDSVFNASTMGSPVFLYLLFDSWSNRGMPACAAIPFLCTHRENSLVAAVAQRIKTWWWAVPSMSLGAPLRLNYMSLQPSFITATCFVFFFWFVYLGLKVLHKTTWILAQSCIASNACSIFQGCSFFYLIFFPFCPLCFWRPSFSRV